jgi:hypothetical protein
MPLSSLWTGKTRIHDDHRNLSAPPTSFVYPQDSVRGEHEKSLQAHMGQFHAAAIHSVRAAEFPLNHKGYFVNKAALERDLNDSQRTMLSHMAGDDTARAASFNWLSNAMSRKSETPTKIDFESVRRGLFIASVFAQDRNRKKFRLPANSNAPQEYFKCAKGRKCSSTNSDDS